MPSFGTSSRMAMETLHPGWIPILEDVIEWLDFRVICGYRGPEAQTRAFESGLSRKPWPQSIHNQQPSRAVDVAPYHAVKPHIRWKARNEFYYLAGALFQAAHAHEHALRWGGDWDRDHDLNDQTFMDIGHFELLVP